MNISSILITIVGIIIIIALYVMSRVGQNKIPKNSATNLPDIKDDKGEQFTSILDDIPATDGVKPVVINSQTPEPQAQSKQTEQRDTNDKHQIILFISSDSETTLDGTLIKQSLIDNGLVFGDKDIYHFFLENSTNENNINSSSLFRVANGIEPWTLKDQDLDNKQIVGLSLVMLLPTFIETKEALKLFIQKAEAIAIQSNGILKNQQQQTLTEADKQEILSM